MKELDSVLHKRKVVLKERDKLNSAIGTLKAADMQIEKEISEIRDNIEQINGLGPESECPTCLRRLGETFGKLLKSFEKEMQKKEKAAA